MNANDFWGQINHLDIDQLKRQNSAISMKPDMLSVSLADSSGLFQGTKAEYHTSLTSCDCIDYRVRGLPCKHMYRLSTELGTFDYSDNIKMYKELVKTRKKIDELLNQMTIKKLNTLLETLTIDI